MNLTNAGPGPDAHWRRANEAARGLRDALAALGVPATELETLAARDLATTGLRIIVPPLSVETVDRILLTMLPNLGPQFIGWRDTPPTAPLDASAHREETRS